MMVRAAPLSPQILVHRAGCFDSFSEFESSSWLCVCLLSRIMDHFQFFGGTARSSQPVVVLI